MAPRVARVVCTVALGYTLALLPELCADEKPGEEKPAAPAKAPAPKATDWSKYVTVADVVGEVVKADDKGLTLRVTWLVQEVKGGNKNNNRPPLGQNNRNFKGGNNRQQQPKVTVKEEHHDYELEFVPESLVRTKLLPPKTDDKGRRVNHTAKELEALRAPPGAPWYAASPADLGPGSVVEVILVRERTVPAAKATEDDLRVKYAVLLGQDATPPKEDKKDDKRKKN